MLTTVTDFAKEKERFIEVLIPLFLTPFRHFLLCMHCHTAKFNFNFESKCVLFISRGMKRWSQGLVFFSFLVFLTTFLDDVYEEITQMTLLTYPPLLLWNSSYVLRRLLQSLKLVEHYMNGRTSLTCIRIYALAYFT
jgi:hypothetical protein